MRAGTQNQKLYVEGDVIVKMYTKDVYGQSLRGRLKKRSVEYASRWVKITQKAETHKQKCEWWSIVKTTWKTVEWFMSDRLLNKKAVLSQRWPRDEHYIWVMSRPTSHVSSQSRTRVKLNSVFFVRFLVSLKFPHVSLGVGGWLLGYEERRCWANCSCN